MILIFIESTNAFAVNYEHFIWWLTAMFFNFYRFCPNPKTLMSISISNIIFTFVQGLIVGPTPNPLESFLFRIIRFKRKDLPVRYFPATAITPILSLIPLSNYFASSLTSKPILKIELNLRAYLFMHHK